MGDDSRSDIPPDNRPRIAIPPDKRERLAREYGPDLECLQRRLQREVRPRVFRELRSRAERFCRFVNGNKCQDYIEAGRLLQRYLRGEISAQAVCDEVTAHTVPAPWALQVYYHGKRRTPRFTYKEHDWGWIDAWRHLAMLLEEGVAMSRLKVCALSGCDRLFYDASPNGNRSTCCTRHKNRLASRTYRQRRGHVKRW